MTFFLQLPGNKYHVNCAAPTPEPALRFRQDKIYNMHKKTGEHDFGQHFACHRKKGDAATVATTVATLCSVTFLLVYSDDVCILQLLSGPAVKDKIMQP